MNVSPENVLAAIDQSFRYHTGRSTMTERDKYELAIEVLKVTTFLERAKGFTAATILDVACRAAQLQVIEDSKDGTGESD